MVFAKELSFPTDDSYSDITLTYVISKVLVLERMISVLDKPISLQEKSRHVLTLHMCMISPRLMTLMTLMTLLISQFSSKDFLR